MTPEQRAAMEQAREALKSMYIEGFTMDNSPLSTIITALTAALANDALDKMAENERELGIQMQPAQQEPVADDFEAWVASYSTLPTGKNAHGYEDFTVEILWHAWQAAQKTKAPEGALEGKSDASVRLGLADTDYNCIHEFAVQPSSGMKMCVRCGLSELAAKKRTRPQAREWQGLTLEEKHQLNDALNLQGRFAVIDVIEAKLRKKNT